MDFGSSPVYPERMRHLTFGVSCKPEKYGFWYRVVGPPGARFWFRFVAIGTGGHQTVGEVGGVIGEVDWLYWAVHFPVMHAALLAFDVTTDANSTTQTEDPVPKGLVPPSNGISSASEAPGEFMAYGSPYRPYPYP